MEPQPLPVEPIVKPQTPWLKVVLFSLAGLTLLGGSFYAGYWWANQQPVVPSPKEEVSTAPTPLVTKEPTEEWQTYHDKAFGYHVDYSQDWKVETWGPLGSQADDTNAQDIRFYFPVTMTDERGATEIFYPKGVGGIGIRTRTNRTALELLEWLKEEKPYLAENKSLQYNAKVADQPAIFIADNSPCSIAAGSWYTYFQRGQIIFSIEIALPYDEDAWDYDLYDAYLTILKNLEFEDVSSTTDELPTRADMKPAFCLPK